MDYQVTDYWANTLGDFTFWISPWLSLKPG